MRIAILLLAYGSPRSVEEVPEFFVNIRRYYGSPPPTDEEIRELIRKYEVSGFQFYEITLRQFEKIKSRLDSDVYLAFKHSPPYIDDVLEEINKKYDKIFSFTLAPHISYKVDLDKVYNIPPWGTDEIFVDFSAYWLSKFHRNEKVIFSVHSLPKRFLSYEEFVRKSAKLISEKIGIKSYEVAFQSRGKFGEWLEPDISSFFNEDGILIFPFGFITENVETLYDIDFFIRNKNIRRVPLMNDNDDFIKSLVEIIKKRTRQKFLTL